MCPYEADDECAEDDENQEEGIEDATSCERGRDYAISHDSRSDNESYGREERVADGYQRDDGQDKIPSAANSRHIASLGDVAPPDSSIQGIAPRSDLFGDQFLADNEPRLEKVMDKLFTSVTVFSVPASSTTFRPSATGHEGTESTVLTSAPNEQVSRACSLS